MLALTVLGVPVPDSRPVFLVALGVHVCAGLTGVLAGGLAAASRKRPGRHPRAGVVYLVGIAGVFVTATVMATMRWRHNWHLLLIAVVAAGLAAVGWAARRRGRRRGGRWMLWHGAAMAGSYVALLTGFYVDNGPNLPGWDRLPGWSLWLIPAVFGAPVTVWALYRNRVLPLSRRPNAAARTAAPP